MRPQVARFRAEFINHSRRLRMAEPCIVIVLFVTLSMVLPLFFPCTPTQVRVGRCFTYLSLSFNFFLWFGVCLQGHCALLTLSMVLPLFFPCTPTRAGR